MEINRILQLAPLLAMKSFFLFGPRATGKTTLIRQQLAETTTIIDLLDSRYFLRLSSAPHELESIIAAAPADIIVIDEIQRIPELLNEIHRLIESQNLTSNLYGKSFEQFICMELRAYLSYTRKKLPLTYWRSKTGHEVDFLLGTRTAVKVKATKKISSNHLKGLKYLKEEEVFQNFILVSQDPVSTLTDNILTIP